MDLDFVVDLFYNEPESTMQFHNFGHIGVGNFSTCRGRWNQKAYIFNRLLAPTALRAWCSFQLQGVILRKYYV